MIIYGHRQRETDVATGEFYCPRCQTQRTFLHKRVDRYFTLFFIPLFRLGRLGEYVQCQTCFGTYKTDVLNLPFARVGVPEGSEQVETQPAHIRPVTPDRSGLGWLLVVLGGVVFLCGGIFGLLMTIGQLTGEAGPTNDLETFIGAVIVCPVPLVVLGMVGSAGGSLILWKNRQDASAAEVGSGRTA